MFLYPFPKTLSILLAVLAVLFAGTGGTGFAAAATRDHNGPYSGSSETTHSIDPAIPYNDDRIQGWATGVEAYYRADGEMGFSDANRALGAAGTSVYDIVSLGDLDADAIAAGDLPGYIELSFGVTIANSTGPDFAVFENGISDDYCELAFVEVSTDGETFARFGGTYFGAATAPVGGYAFIDATYIYNLAGKHKVGFGTPFDLEQLVEHPQVTGGQVDLNNIHFVRLVDIPGSGDWLDDSDNPIYDSWLTFDSGGADIDGVAVLNIPDSSADTLALHADPSQGTVGDPGTTVTITSDVLYGEDETALPDGTCFTVSTTLGTLLSADAAPEIPGIQVASTEGIISFSVQAGHTAGTAFLKVSACDSLLHGELVYQFHANAPVGPVNIYRIDSTHGPVTFSTSPIRDAWDNVLNDGTHVTLVTEGGTLLTRDAAPELPGHQIGLSGGIAEFSVRVLPAEKYDTTVLSVYLYADPETTALIGEDHFLLDVVPMPQRYPAVLWVLLLGFSIGIHLRSGNRRRLS